MRVVVVVVSIWVYSGFLSLMKLWVPFNAWNLIGTITAPFGFIITLVAYIRIYKTVRRHKNHIESMQIRDEAQSVEIKNLTVLIKSTIGIFYVYIVFLICYLPYLIYHLQGCYSNLWLEYRFEETFSLLIDSRVSEFIFEPCYLLLEDETHSTRYHRHTTKDALDQQLAISGKLQSVIECRPY